MPPTRLPTTCRFKDLPSGEEVFCDDRICRIPGPGISSSIWRNSTETLAAYQEGVFPSLKGHPMYYLATPHQIQSIVPYPYPPVYSAMILEPQYGPSIPHVMLPTCPYPYVNMEVQPHPVPVLIPTSIPSWSPYVPNPCYGTLGRDGRGRCLNNEDVDLAELRSGRETRTCVMIRNIPNRYNPEYINQLLFLSVGGRCVPIG